MIKFDNGNFVSNPGSPIHILYAPKVCDDGHIELVPCGKENTDEMIQSHLESTDINLILNRVAQGDMSGLTVKNGAYGDFTNVPKTFAEALQLQIDSNRLFESLPVNIRDKFMQDPNEFFAKAGTEEWFEKLNGIIPREMNPGVIKTEEVKNEGGVVNES